MYKISSAVRTKIALELKNAMLTKNSDQVSILKMIQSEIINFEKSGKSMITRGEILFN